MNEWKIIPQIYMTSSVNYLNGDMDLSICQGQQCGVEEEEGLRLWQLENIKVHVQLVRVLTEGIAMFSKRQMLVPGHQSLVSSAPREAGLGVSSLPPLSSELLICT